ncbi:MAG: DUF479 domain-containing protein [Halioglobus sp.]|nr:DUF479 domain-containing protein [Halioglobus sp.]
MNYLAHFHLAWPDPGLVAGGLEGDFYKGTLRGELPAALERGVRLHRAIDAYTDRHPLVHRLRREFPPDLRRYAGILVDLCFDHYLSVHWQTFANIPMEEFKQAVYGHLREHESALSHGSRTLLQGMVRYDILGGYLDWDSVPAGAARIGQRLRRDNPLGAVATTLVPLRDSLERTFLDFYPELQRFCARQKAR